MFVTRCLEISCDSSLFVMMSLNFYGFALISGFIPACLDFSTHSGQPLARAPGPAPGGSLLRSTRLRVGPAWPLSELGSDRVRRRGSQQASQLGLPRTS